MQNLNFSSFLKLSTKRLILRRLVHEDKNEIISLRSDDRVNKFLDRKKTFTIEEAEAFIRKIDNGISENTLVYWAVSTKYDPKLIGTICLFNIDSQKESVEIGYELSPDFQGKGIMQEALLAVLRFGFENLEINIINAYTHPENIKSINLLQRNGFGQDTNYKNTDLNEVKYLLERF